MNAYPQYYKNGTLCIWRESDLKGEQIEITRKGKWLSLVRTKLTYPDKGRFDCAVLTMQSISGELYGHIGTLYARLIQSLDPGKAQLRRTVQMEIDRQIRRVEKETIA